MAADGRAAPPSTREVPRKPSPEDARLDALLQMGEALAGADDLEEVFAETLSCLRAAVHADRAAILLTDMAGVMRFAASAELSAEYRQRVEGHSPWPAGDPDPQPVLVRDVEASTGYEDLLPTLRAEGIRALAFVPLLHRGELIGKFMLYFAEPHDFTTDELRLSQSIATQIAAAVSRRSVDHELRVAASLQEATLESTADGILVIGLDRRVTSYNRRFAEMWGLSPDVLTASDNRAALADASEQLKDPKGFRQKVEEVYESPDTELTDHLEFNDGRVFQRVSRPQRLDGEFVGRVWSFRDVTAERRAREALAHRAERDELTELPNRRLFGEHLELTLEDAAKRETAAALLYVDLDRFKLVNDSLGHPAGDAVLIQVAERLRNEIRSQDVAARHSGDEFLILLGDLDPSNARAAAEDVA
ncbi:MAG: diguanylate cyclase domain-containing protein, partial [Solirubrobacterales bacterium]